MYVRPGLIVDPVETCLNSESRQHPVLGAIAIARRHVDGTSLVVQGICRMHAFLVPTFDNSQFHSGPLVHHRDRQSVKFLFASL